MFGETYCYPGENVGETIYVTEPRVDNRWKSMYCGITIGKQRVNWSGYISFYHTGSELDVICREPVVTNGSDGVGFPIRTVQPGERWVIVREDEMLWGTYRTREEAMLATRRKE